MSGSARRRSGAGSSASTSPSCRSTSWGLEGMTRRLQHYDRPEWHPWLLVAAAGRAAHPLRHRAADRAARGLHPHPRRNAASPPAIRGTAAPRVGDRLAAAGVQLRGAAQRHGARSPTGSMKQQAREHDSAWSTARAALRAHRDAAQQPDRVRHGVLRGRDRLRADLAHLVAGRARAARRLRDLRRLRLARCRTSSRSRPRRWRASTAPTAPRAPQRAAPEAGPMSTAALRARTIPIVAAPPGSARAAQVTGHGAGGPAPKRIVVGYGFWIFLLSDVIMFSAFFATYAVLFKNTAGGPSAQRALRPAQHRGGDGVPARLELHLRDGEPRGRAAQPEVDADRPAGHRTPRPRLHHARGPRVRRLRRARRRSRAAAPSCLPSSPWSDATACT